MSNYTIQTIDLEKKFKSVSAVDNLNLAVPEGSIYGFLGPNGAGKTTTIRMILGLASPTRGKVNVFGKNVAKNRKEILKDIGALVENPSFYSNLTAEENLEVIGVVLGIKKERIREVLEIVGLERTKKKKVGKFSLGMKQRLALAFALLNNPKLLILDEPTNGLDPKGIIEMRNLIKSLPEKGVTVFLSSHMLSEVELIANHIGIINNGKLLFQGTLKELREKQEIDISLRVDDIAGAKKLLTKSGYKCEDDDGMISIKVENGEKGAEINSLLVSSGIKVFSLFPKVSNLEDIFVNLTNKK